MADVTDAFLRGTAARAAVENHDQAIEENKLRMMMLKLQLDAHKADNAYREYDAKTLHASHAFDAANLQPAPMGLSQVGDVPDIPTPQTPPAIQFPALPPEIGGGAPGFSRQPVTLEQHNAALLQQKIDEARINAAGKSLEPFSLNEGQIRYAVDPFTGQPRQVGAGGTKEKNEWNSFQDAYASELGKGNWAELDPKQKMLGFSTFNTSKQNPDVAALAHSTALLHNALLKVQIDQQPTKEDADAIAQDLIDHKMAPSQLNLFGGFGLAGQTFKRNVLLAAHAKDSGFDMEQAESDYQLAKSPGFQTTVRFMDSVTNSMPRLLQSAKTLANGNVASVNALLNQGKAQVNNVDLKRFNVDRLFIADEIAKILQGGGTGSGTSDAKLQQGLSVLKDSDSPAAVAGALEEATALIGMRRNSLTRGTYYASRPAADTAPAAPSAGALPGFKIERH